jgi:hypothetical protein
MCVVHQNPPERCDLCEEPVTAFVNGRTKYGPWADMCQECWSAVGVGLGLGCGQFFVRQGHHFVKQNAQAVFVGGTLTIMRKA